MSLFGGSLLYARRTDQQKTRNPLWDAGLKTNQQKDHTFVVGAARVDRLVNSRSVLDRGDFQNCELPH